MADRAELQKTWMKVVAKAWADEGYKARLLDAPEELLKAEGVSLPAGKAVRVVEGAPGEALFVLPPQAAVLGGAAAEEERISPFFFF